MNTVEYNFAIAAIQRAADNMEIMEVDPDAVKDWVTRQVNKLKTHPKK